MQGIATIPELEICVKSLLNLGYMTLPKPYTLLDL